MCPIDPSPHAGEVLHEPDKQFPVPTPDLKHGHPPEGQHSGQGRPAIPSSSERMAVDIEDEEADPVVESGPGVDKPQTSLFTRD